MRSEGRLRAKLTNSEAVSIFRLRETAASATSVGRLYGVSEKAIRDIWKGRTWASETSNVDTAQRIKIKPKVQRDENRRKNSHVQQKSAVVQEEICADTQNQHQPLCMHDVPVVMSVNQPCSASLCQNCISVDPRSDSLEKSVDDQLFEWEQHREPQVLLNPLDWLFLPSKDDEYRYKWLIVFN
jgi:hypothetical protein